MGLRKQIAATGLVLLLCGVTIGAFAQDDNFLPQDVQESAATAIDQILTFIDSASTYLGQGVIYLLNLVTGDRVSSNLEKPIGYLAFITLLLLFFGLLDFARKIIWIGIIVGWVLLIVRIILDALNL